MSNELLTPKDNPYNNPTGREREEDGMLSKYEIFEAGAKAQLTKARPIIEKQERERIHNAIIETASIQDIKGSKQRMLIILLSQFYKALRDEGMRR